MSEDTVRSTAPTRVAVLGPVAVRSTRGALVEPTGQRAKALLVALALASPRAVSAERLTDDIWGDEPPRGARAALQTLVSRIRSTLGDDLIESLPSGYRLAADTDLELAERLLGEARSAWEGAGSDGDRSGNGDGNSGAKGGRYTVGNRGGNGGDGSGSAVGNRGGDDSGGAIGNRGGDGNAGGVLEATRATLDLWRGEPGADLENPELAAALRERAGHLLDALETLRATAALESGQAGEAERLARSLCRRAPFDDAAHLLLMRALDALGRPTEAVSVYAEFRERVQDAFGTSPDVELQHLNLDLLDRETAEPSTRTKPHPHPAEHVHEPEHSFRPSHADDGDAETETTPATSPAHPAPAARIGIGSGIRAAPNALIGRETALAAILQLVATARITTILGPGGLGKTRVAHEVARRALADFGAVIVVELASVRSADDVVFALASALGIREVGTSRRLGDQLVRADLRTRILARLAATDTLLVLDNCEHLIDAAAAWSVELTGELPDLTVLTTSRTPLAVSSERVFALEPLGLRGSVPGEVDAAAPDSRPTDDAVTLFLDRATAARPDAVLPPDSVAALCARLDGLPLAIELAAARVRTMSIDEIGRRLSNRFALLSGGDRSAPERHRTLRAVIEWSWNLLGTAEQRALARLSEFADGFSAEAAAAVVDHAPDVDVESLLDGLVAQSLVMVRESPGGLLRYRMLETVREYGRLQLGEGPDRAAADDALCAWADAFACHRTALMDGATQVTTFTEIAAEEDNLIDVLRHALDAGRAEVATSVFSMLAYYWTLRSAHSEVLAFSKPVFEVIRHHTPAPERARVEQYAVSLLLMTATTMLTDMRFGVLPFSRLRRLVREHPLEPSRLASMVDVILTAGDQEEMMRRVAVAIASPDKSTALVGSLIASVAAENEGDRERAIAMARGAARLAGALHDTWGDAMASQMLASLHSQSADPEEALRWARRARSGLDRLGATDDLRQLDWTVATNALALGDLDGAAELFEQIVRLPGETDGIDYLSIGLFGQAEVLRARGLPAESFDRQLAALASFETPRHRASPWYRMLLSATLTCATIDGTATDAQATMLARRLRSRSLAVLRSSPYTDRPVLGAALIGLAVWREERAHRGAARRSAPGVAGATRAAATATAAPSPADAIEARTAAELLCLAEALSARQDSPALHLAPLFQRFARSLPAAEIAELRASVAALPDDEKPARARQLLGARGPWSWPIAGRAS